MVKVETVSSHFSYTEEYVLDHSPEWVDRKYWQAMKEKFDDSQARVLEGFKSLALIVDSIFNKGANYHLFVHESFEDALKQGEEKVDSNFIQGQWWMNDRKQVKSSE